MNLLIIFGAKYLIFILLLIAMAYVFKQDKERRRKIFVFAVITLPAAYIVAKIASILYYDPRPFVVGNFTPMIAHIADNGFPSDHTLLSAAAASIVYFFNKKVGVFLFVLALLVGASRVLAGVHHAMDIAGSLVIAMVVSFFVYNFILPAVYKSGFFQKLRK